jgi:hypothetical protein
MTNFSIDAIAPDSKSSGRTSKKGCGELAKTTPITNSN